MPKHPEPEAEPTPPAPPAVIVPPEAIVPPAEPPSRSEIREAQREAEHAAKAAVEQVVARYTGGPAGAYEEGIKAQDIRPEYWSTLTEAQREQVRRSQVYAMVREP